MSDEPQQLQLSGRQRALYEALSEKEQSLADMYLGSLMTLQQAGNPDSLALAAHGLRELMEKLPIYLDAPVDVKTQSLKGKVRELVPSWSGTLERSSCYSESGWSGEIDRHLRKFLKRSHRFFDWFEAERPTRKQKAAEALRELDPLKQPLPEPIAGLRVEEWDRFHDFFEGVSHHGINPSQDDFTVWQSAFESFLLDRLRPRTFEDHAEIDKIISEGENNADR